MVALAFDATNVKPNDGVFKILPPGKYPAVITESEMKLTNDKTGQFLELNFEVIDGPERGSTFKDRLNLQNSSQKTVDIAYGTLSAICHSVGVIQIQDSSQLHHKPIMVTLGVQSYKKQDGTDGSSNEVKRYEKYAPGSTAPANTAPPATASGQGPWAGGQPAGQPAATVQPSAVSATPSWATPRTAG